MRRFALCLLACASCTRSAPEPQPSLASSARPVAPPAAGETTSLGAIAPYDEVVLVAATRCDGFALLGLKGSAAYGSNELCGPRPTLTRLGAGEALALDVPGESYEYRDGVIRRTTAKPRVLVVPDASHVALRVAPHDTGAGTLFAVRVVFGAESFELAYERGALAGYAQPGCGSARLAPHQIARVAFVAGDIGGVALERRGDELAVTTFGHDDGACTQRDGSLGTCAANQPVLATVRVPAGSTVLPRVEVVDAAGAIRPFECDLR